MFLPGCRSSDRHVGVCMPLKSALVALSYSLVWHHTFSSRTISHSTNGTGEFALLWDLLCADHRGGALRQVPKPVKAGEVTDQPACNRSAPACRSPSCRMAD